MDSPSYNRNQALSDQIKWLELKKQHLEKIIAQAKAMQGGLQMTDFTAYNQTELKAFQREAKERWGQTRAYQECEQKHTVIDFSTIETEMAKLMADFGHLKDRSVSDDEVQAQVKVLQDYITSNHYTCTTEILANLGDMYVSDDRFTQMIDGAGGSGTAIFVARAIAIYCSSK